MISTQIPSKVKQVSVQKKKKIHENYKKMKQLNSQLKKMFQITKRRRYGTTKLVIRKIPVQKYEDIYLEKATGEE